MAVANVFAALIASPSLAIDDRFPLVPDDFPERFHKIIFGAVQHLVSSGVKHLDEAVIDDYLSNYPAQHKVFTDNSGIEYLQRAAELGEIPNYEYYHDLLKKYSLLNRLDSQGFDISKFYNPDALDVASVQTSQSNLDQYS